MIAHTIYTFLKQNFDMENDKAIDLAQQLTGELHQHLAQSLGAALEALFNGLPE